MTDCLRPLLVSMRLFGLYFVRESEAANERKKCRCNAWMIHSVVVLALLWLNVARMFSVFSSDEVFGMVVLNKIVTVTWMTQCAVSQTSLFASCHLGTLHKVFAKVKLSDQCAPHIRRIAVIYTVAAWSVMAIGSAFFGYGLLFTDGSMDYGLAPIGTHVTVSGLILVPRIIMYIFSFYLVAAHAFPQAMTYLLARLFSYQFKNVGDELDRCLERDEGRVGDADIEAIRHKHQEISTSVSNIDDCLMFSNASAFCCQLCCFIVLLYMLIFYHSDFDDPVIITANVFWMALMTLGLVFTSAGGIQVNHYVSIEPHCVDIYHACLILTFAACVTAVEVIPRSNSNFGSCVGLHILGRLSLPPSVGR